MDREHPPISFGALLRHYRQEARLTQKELAERAQVSEHTISNIERGASHAPRPDLVGFLAHALRLSPEEEAQFLASAKTLRLPRASRVYPTTAFPLPPTTLIGRNREVAALTGLLRAGQARLVTLTGMGGVGKTHLALEIVHQLAERWQFSTTFVDLAGISSPELVLPMIGQRLKVQERSGHSLLDDLRTFLQAQSWLLVLDNFEHLLPAALHLVELLKTCPQLQLLVTSRMALQVRGEQEFPVLPLALPDLGETSLESLAQIPSVMLFAVRAQAMQPSFVLTGENAATIAAICRRLDGLPLALELAVAQLRLLSPKEILARLDHPLALLTRGPQDLPLRQKTLRATLDWSYALLPAASQQLFQRLAVFAGSIRLEAIEQVCQVPEPLVLELLHSLVNAQMVQRVSAPSDDLRIRLLDVMQAYAWEHLQATDEAESLQRAHATYYVTLAERAAPALRGPDQQNWQQRLEQESENVRAALDWAIAQTDGELGLRLAGALWRFWYQRGALSEGRYWLERALATTKPAGPAPARALALYGSGVLAFGQGSYAQARDFLQSALEMSQTLGDQHGMAQVLNNLGGIARMEGDYLLATALYEEGLGCYRALGDQHGISVLLGNLAALAWEQGAYEQAQRLAEESLALEQALGNQTGAAITMEGLGLIALDQGDITRAQRWFENALEIGRALSDGRRIARALGYLGKTLLVEGHAAQAAACYKESLAQTQTVEDRVGSAEAWLGLGEVALAEGKPQQAAQCYRTSLALHQHLGKKRGMVQALEGLSQAYSLDSVQPPDETWRWAVQLAALAAGIRATYHIGTAPVERTRLRELETALRAKLSDKVFMTAWSSGTALSIEAVLEKDGSLGKMALTQVQDPQR
jgi:predicted ATPase/DNA-binding XRE family transcriptional regulator